jgi:N-acetylneuraminic acid mutarotase
MKNRKIFISKNYSRVYGSFLLLLLYATAVNAQLVTPTGNLVKARMSHGSHLLSNGKVLVFGGHTGNSNQPLNTTELYDPVTGSWSLTASMNTTRQDFASVLLDNGNVLVAGGLGFTSFNPTRSCELYDIVQHTWRPAGDMVTARTNFRLVNLGNGKILAVGEKFGSKCELYDQATNTWTPTGSLSYSNRYAGFDAVKLPNGNVLLVGGDNSPAEIYNTKLGIWAKVANPMNYYYKRAELLLLQNGKVLITGSEFHTEVFDPVSMTFTKAGNRLTLHNGCKMISLDDGRALVVGSGGGQNPADYTKYFEFYDPERGFWTNTGSIAPPFFGAKEYSIHRLQNGKILLVGGSNNQGFYAVKSCFLVDQSQVTGISDQAAATGENMFSVYPNPASEEFNVEISMLSSKSMLQVMNINGQIVYEKELPAGAVIETLKVNSLPKGIYYVRLISDKMVDHRKLVLQ